MAYTPLRTDFKDDILDPSNYKRKYKQVANNDGTFSLQDETTYQQVGSDYGAKEVNEEREAINNIYENKLVALDDVALVTEEGFFVDALAVKELNSKLKNAETTIKNNLMSINTYPVTLNTSNVKTSDSWIECNRIGNLVMVNGCVKITKDVNVYTGINLASGAPAPCCDKQLYTGAIAQDNTYSSCLLSVSKNGEIDLYVRWQKALAGDVFYYEFCYICK